MKLWIVYSLIAFFFYGWAEYFSKLYADTSKIKNLFLALFLYMLTTILWFPSLKNNNHLILMTTLWTIFYVILGLVVGLIFHEKLTATQWIGLGMAILSIILITR